MFNYDFKQISCVVGTGILTGFADGDGIVITPDSNAFNLTIGADGEGTRSKTNNESATVKVRLQKTSLANAVLNDYYQADKTSGSGVFPFLVKDILGSELHAAEQMWIEKAPEAPFGAESPVREWTLRTDKMKSIFGGNV